MNSFTESLALVHERIATAARLSGRRPDEVRLLAVSKRQPLTAIRALANAGQHDFGENYLSEGRDKIDALRELALGWHFIGPIQSNKTKPIAEYFDWVHSADRAKVLRRLSDQRPTALAPLNVCLQIRIGEESTKSGADPEAAGQLAELAASLPGLRLRGLMCIPPASNDCAQQRAWFEQLAALQQQLIGDGHGLDTLSMGMSNDLEAAIAAGATMVRVGTALFGPRPTED